MYLAALSLETIGTYIAVAVFFVGLVVVLFWKKPDTSAAERRELMEKYAFLSRQTLDGLPDEAVVQAVVANLMAKDDPARPDPYGIIASQTRGRRVVYTGWILVNELKTVGAAKLLSGRSAKLIELGIDAFEALGAPACAETCRKLSELRTLHGKALTAPAAEVDAAFAAAAESEQPLALMLEYIRDNAHDFADDTAFADTLPEEDA